MKSAYLLYTRPFPQLLPFAYYKWLATNNFFRAKRNKLL